MLAPPPIEAEFELKWRIGARTATLICHIAGNFMSAVKLKHADVWVNAKDMLGVLLLGEIRPKLPDGSYNFGPDAGALIKITVTGPDATNAAKALEELFTVGERTIQCRNTDCISSAILTGYDRHRIYYSCSNMHLWSVLRDSGVVELSRFRFFERA